MAQDLARRVCHAMKVGLALLLTSLYILIEEPPSILGENAAWATITVLFVFEFTVGATISKGLNRGIGTLLGGLACVGVSRLGLILGEKGEAIFILVSIFMAGTLATFIRFLPWVKARYDYGVLMFVVTFSLICVSNYQKDDFVRTAINRLSMISVGCGITLVINVLVLPVWAGETLHNMVANNLDTLARCIEATVKAYLEAPLAAAKAEEGKTADNDTIYVMYHDLLSSIWTEQPKMATFAEWEPPHGRFLRLGYPWKQYLKVGSAICHFAYASMALHGCLRSERQAPDDLRQAVQHDLLKVSTDVSYVLRELARSIKTMQMCLPADALLTMVTASTEKLQKSIDVQLHLFVKTSSKYDHFQMPSTCNNYTSLTRYLSSASNLATFGSLLIETVNRLGKVVESIQDLGHLAKFKVVEQDIDRHL